MMAKRAIRIITEQMRTSLKNMEIIGSQRIPEFQVGDS